MIHKGGARRTNCGPRPAGRLSEAAQFFRSWTEKPMQLGSVTPSSRILSKVMASHVDPASEGPVVEIGPGTGPITQALVEHGIAEERLVLVEYSPEFCDLLARRFPKAQIVQGDAYALARTLDGKLDGKAAAMVCGLPLMTRPEAQRLDLLAQAFTLMQPGAPFVQFTYALTSPIPTRDAFFTWKGSPRIWRNVPPARVWTYTQLSRN
ncbi:methyltransferase [Labrys miyagiensis]|uniref:Methyltransferase n=1 Tax=Labrys miyagiensis TaxID=346912 RepID=A0ABQ6CFX2_9HYPH|nr:methyltransferase domain-containing protein [Labrys miyagiensis]GLS19055.1 methyltransferase [Labrys miyagiensis]